MFSARGLPLGYVTMFSKVVGRVPLHQAYMTRETRRYIRIIEGLYGGKCPPEIS